MPNWVRQNSPELWDRIAQLSRASQAKLLERLCMRVVQLSADTFDPGDELRSVHWPSVDAEMMFRASRMYDDLAEKLEAQGHTQAGGAKFRCARLAYAIGLCHTVGEATDVEDVLYELAYALPHPRDLIGMIAAELEHERETGRA